jgi:hypothetical protein
MHTTLPSQNLSERCVGVDDKTEGVYSIYLVQNRDNWWALANTVIYLHALQLQEISELDQQLLASEKDFCVRNWVSDY